MKIMELIKQIDCVGAIYKALRTPTPEGVFTDTMSLAMSLAREVPTIEAEPVKHGRWIKLYFGNYKCSECGDWWHGDDNEVVESFKFCPNCGAKMEEVEK